LVAPELAGKLGAETTGAVASAATAVVVVNGPQDAGLDWDAVDWRSVEDDVRRLRRRILTASDNAPGTCLSRVPRRVARTVLRGPGR